MRLNYICHLSSLLLHLPTLIPLALSNYSVELERVPKAVGETVKGNVGTPLAPRVGADGLPDMRRARALAVGVGCVLCAVGVTAPR